MRSLHFAASVLLTVAVTTVLLLIVASVVIAAGFPASLSAAMHSNAEQPIRRAIGQAELVLLVFYVIVCPLIAVAVGWVGGRREKGVWATATSVVGALPLAALVAFTGSLRAWAIIASVLYVVLGAGTAAVASSRRVA